MMSKSPKNFIHQPEMIKTTYWSEEILLSCSAKLAPTLVEHPNSNIQLLPTSDFFYILGLVINFIAF